MMRSRLLTHEDLGADAMALLRALADSAGTRLPFCRPEMPLAWWRNFSSSNGEPFSQNRGRNFLGAQCWLKDFFYLVAEEGGRLCGAVPVASYAVRLPDVQGLFRMLTFAGDYVLAPYQDFLALPGHRREALSVLLDASIGLLKEGHDLIFFGHIPGESPSISVIDELLPGLHPDISWKKCVTSQRGGVHPWTLNSLQKLLFMLNHKIDVERPEYEPVLDLSSRLMRCSPDTLFFPRNRRELEEKFKALAMDYAQADSIRDEVESIHRLLVSSPIDYLFIELPADREAYLQGLGKKTRFNYRHDRKRLLNHGFTIEKLPAGSIREKDILDYLQLHMMRWGKRSVAISDRTAGFHRQLCTLAAREGYLTLFFVRSGDRRIAAHSCFDILDRREAYFTGLDPDYEKSGAGIVLFHETILDAIDSGFTRYEFGYGGDDYKFKFTHSSSRTYNYFLSPRYGMPDLEKLFLGFECMVECGIRTEMAETLHREGADL